MATKTVQSAQPAAAQVSTNGHHKDKGKDKSQRQRATKILPTERIKFDKQLDILRAYASASGPENKAVTNGQIAEIVNLMDTTISMGNAFLNDVKLIVKGDGGFTPSADVMAFNRQYEWSPESAAHKLAPVLERTWFVQRLLPKLRFRQLSDEEAVADLADEAHAGPQYRGQLRILLEYAAAAGLIVRDNGMIRLGKVDTSPSAASASQEASAGGDKPPQPVKSGAVMPPIHATEGQVQFHISVRVSMSEFADWQADRITAFFGGIAQVLAAKGQLTEETHQE